MKAFDCLGRPPSFSTHIGGLGMKKRKRWIPLAVLGVLVIAVALTCRVTIIPDEAPQTIVNEAGETVTVAKLTRAEQYRQDNWDSKILPAIHERAVELPAFLKDVTADLNEAGKAYGSRANETSAWSFCVKGAARVLAVENGDKPTKTTLLLDVTPFDGEADCKLHYGKVFSSNIKNAVRDGVGFLKLDDFANQVEFADITTAFNDKIKEEIILALPAEDYVGRTISLYGCISLQNAQPDSLVIVPVELGISEE